MEEANFSLEEFIAGGNNNFRVIEEQIDIDTQASYFRYSQKIKGKAEVNSTIEEYDLLFDASVSLRKKKKVLASLASCQNVATYRLLEGYRLKPDPLLKDWAILAYNESRMLLENSFSDEDQVFISTGMGGKGNKLRYFIVLFSKKKDGFSDFERKFVKGEVEFTFKQNNSDIENMAVEAPNYITFSALIPIKDSVKQLMHRTFSNCNQLDEFIHQKFIVSNIKTMTAAEILDFYNQK